jgi:hypothetical protein
MWLLSSTTEKTDRREIYVNDTGTNGCQCAAMLRTWEKLHLERVCVLDNILDNFIINFGATEFYTDQEDEDQVADGSGILSSSSGSNWINGMRK